MNHVLLRKAHEIRRGHSYRFVFALSASVIRSQETLHNSLEITIIQLLIILVHRVGFTLEIMWSRNMQNGFEHFVLLWDLNPTTWASRAIALSTRHSTLRGVGLLELPPMGN